LINLNFEPCEEKVLEYVHPKAHVQKVKDTIYDPKGDPKKPGAKKLLEQRKNTQRFHNDTYENAHTATSAFWAAGGACEGVRAVV
jgi:acetoin utilization deacetylase AcuC-like enzyme